jgi:uncharacterized protein (TIGR04255 family)
LQVGPGVFAVNDTTEYTWLRFEELVNWAVPVLIQAHPQPNDLRFETLMLRFMNGILIDPDTNLLTFLKEKMRVNLSLPDSIFLGENVGPKPIRMATEFLFPCGAPKGAFLLKFNTGRRDDRPALVFELWFVSQGADVPAMPAGFRDWLTAAHAVVEKSFFHLIEGDLEKEFAGAD